MNTLNAEPDTLGEPYHGHFLLSATPGAIEGIKEIEFRYNTDPGSISNFEHLAEGNTIHFDEEAHVEILVFGAVFEGVVEATLEVHAVKLRKGGSLTGPVAWRQAGKNSRRPRDHGRHLRRFVALGIILMILAEVYLLDPQIALFLSLPMAGAVIG